MLLNILGGVSDLFLFLQKKSTNSILLYIYLYLSKKPFIVFSKISKFNVPELFQEPPGNKSTSSSPGREVLGKSWITEVTEVVKKIKLRGKIVEGPKISEKIWHKFLSCKEYPKKNRTEKEGRSKSFTQRVHENRSTRFFSTMLIFLTAVVVTSLLAVFVLGAITFLVKYRSLAEFRKIPGPRPNILFGNAWELPSTSEGQFRFVYMRSLNSI